MRLNSKTVFFILAALFCIICTRVCFADDTKKNIQQSLAEAYMIDKDYNNAIVQYREILKSDPANLKARIAIADMLSWKKKYDEAIQEFKKAMEIAPRDLSVKKKLADVCVWKNDFVQAEQLYKG